MSCRLVATEELLRHTYGRDQSLASEHSYCDYIKEISETIVFIEYTVVPVSCKPSDEYRPVLAEHYFKTWISENWLYCFKCSKYLINQSVHTCANKDIRVYCELSDHQFKPGTASRQTASGKFEF